MKSWQIFCVAAVMTASAHAQTVTTFESCTDAAGHTLPAVEDAKLAKLVAVGHDKDGTSIHYNPAVLVRLKPATRLFFFAHECAAISLGDAGKAALSVDRARQADCLGLATLLDGGYLKREELPELQADLNFSEAEWALLPGQPRSFDFAACRSPGVVRLPAEKSPAKPGWDACVRTCAAPLLACGNHCLETYQQCVAGCGGKPDK